MILHIATATSSRASKWKNTVSTWEKIAAKLSETVRTDETIKQYFTYTKDKQGEIKDVGGFVGGKLLPGTCLVSPKGKAPIEVTYKAPYGWRRNGFVECRQVVALDVDFGDLDTWLDFRVLGYAGLMYTTHKHTPAAPRYRIVFPLDREVDPDEYEAVARRVASWLDIEVFDDTTYQPTRLMYYPSTAKDGEFIFDLADGPALSADEALAEYVDWTDPNQWPTSSREVAAHPHYGTTVENPEAKDGLIGAFCRAFTLREAIDEFLSDVYVPCPELGPDRYTYVNGSSNGGLIIYNDRHAYSNHGTDPASRKLCNAFDLVRLHKFGDLDTGKETDDPALAEKLPSFKAMVDFAGKLSAVKKQIVRDRRDKTDSAVYDEIADEAREVAFNDDWIEELETEKDKIKNTINNAVIIILNDEGLRGCFAFNEFEVREVALQKLPWDKPGLVYPRPLTDRDDANLRMYLERCYEVTSVAKITDALNIVVHGNSQNPVKQYLDAIEWDGVERLDTLFVDLFGADDTEYMRAVTRKFFCAAVARAYTPGCHFDYCLILAGDEGTGKSKTIKTFARGWYTNSVPALDNSTRTLEAIQGAWIVEFGELEAMRNADDTTAKAFIDKTEDRFRVAYGKRLEYFPRRVVLTGTTNKRTFLKSMEGNRKFWVVNFIGRGKAGKYWWFDLLTPDFVAQVWGEARQRLAEGELLYLPEHLETIARKIQGEHMETDERAGIILQYLERKLPKNWQNLDPDTRRMWLTDEDNRDAGDAARDEVTVIEIWTECLGRRMEDITRRDGQEIGKIIRSLRIWEAEENPRRVRFYGLQRVYILSLL